ncbi:AtpZ/AtpI family protein [Aquimarina aquimarini]|uniref:AtpZ/AtpI family protein n=1 Tax=Aquimarina aquimarini TaxID=1191734 RepID=UPI002100B934|nr:AtpZ/AtpI family protein [Aquimarina aquimarini]
MSKNQDNRKQRKDRGNQLRKFAKFTTIGIQMMAIIVGGHYLGIYLDEKLGHQVPFYSKWVGMGAVFLAITSVIWQVIKESK